MRAGARNNGFKALTSQHVTYANAPRTTRRVEERSQPRASRNGCSSSVFRYTLEQSQRKEPACCLYLAFARALRICETREANLVLLFFFPSFLRAVSSHEIQLCRDRNFHLRRARRKFRSHPQTRILSDRSALISALCFRFRAGRGVVHAEQRQQPRLPQHDRAEY